MIDPFAEDALKTLIEVARLRSCDTVFFTSHSAIHGFRDAYIGTASEVVDAALALQWMIKEPEAFYQRGGKITFEAFRLPRQQTMRFLSEPDYKLVTEALVYVVSLARVCDAETAVAHYMRATPIETAMAIASNGIDFEMSEALLDS